MQQPIPIERTPSSVIARLRSLVPFRVLSYAQARTLAERLASSFLKLYALDQMPVPAAIVGDLPKVRIEVDRDMPLNASGSSVWDSRASSWVILVNGWEPATRQRFTVFHEFFHIVVHRHVERAGIFRHLTNEQIESIADYFAGCVLVPKWQLIRAWANGVQTTEALGSHFAVSARAMEVRLDQVRLTGKGREFTDIALTGGQ